MGKIDAAGRVDRLRASVLGPHQGRRFLDAPGNAAIEAARLVFVLRLGVIHWVADGIHFEDGGAESDHDLVTPRPDALIGRPSSEASEGGWRHAHKHSRYTR